MSKIYTAIEEAMLQKIKYVGDGEHIFLGTPHDLILDIEKRIVGLLPERVDVDAKYETRLFDGDKGIDLTLYEDDEDPSGKKTGENLVLLAQYAADQGRNELIDSLTATPKETKGLGK